MGALFNRLYRYNMHYHSDGEAYSKMDEICIDHKIKGYLVLGKNMNSPYAVSIVIFKNVESTIRHPVSSINYEIKAQCNFPRDWFWFSKFCSSNKIKSPMLKRHYLKLT